MDQRNKRQEISAEDTEVLFDGKFLRVMDLKYAPGKHYYDATRRTREELVAVKSDEAFRAMLTDAVSCVVVLDMPGQEPRLLLSYEYRYPAGRFLLSVPAGLIDQEDKAGADPVVVTAVREIKEETGLDVKEGDRITVINPLLFSSPGMTDESNALVCAVLHPADLSGLSQEGAVGSEQFDGFALLTKTEALAVLRGGRDEYGNYYSIFTWAALMYFVTDMWKNSTEM